MLRSHTLVLIQAAALLAPACASGGAPETPEHTRGVIRIGATDVRPEEAVIPRGDLAVWANEQDQRAVISFDEEIEEHFTCDTLRPNLYRDGAGHLVSQPIRSLEFQLPCPLEPGVYPYRVHLIRVIAPPGAPIVPPEQEENPDQTFPGTLVVR